MRPLVRAAILYGVFGATSSFVAAQSPLDANHAAVIDPAPQSDTAMVTDTCSSLQKDGARFQAQADFLAASTTLRKALDLCPDRRQILLLLTKAELFSKNLNAAQNTIDTLLASNPNDVDGLIAQAQVLYFNNKDGDAETSLMKAARLAPKNGEPHYWLGRIYYMDSRLPEATKEFQQTLVLSPTYYKAYDGLALCYETSGDVRLATQTFMDGLAIVADDHPRYDIIYADFAELLLKYGEDQKAFSLAVEAAKRNPKEPRNFLLAGRASQDAGNYEVSLRWLTRASVMDASYPDPHYQLARIYRRLGNQEAASTESALFRALSEQAAQTRR